MRNLLLAAVVLLPGSFALGDTVWIQSTANGKPLARTNVTINKIAKDEEGESLYYTTDGGTKEHKALSKVAQIEAEGEPAFNQAELDFNKGDLKAAGENYRRAMSSTSKEWLKHRADVRLLGISSKTGDFLGAMTGFVTMAKTDPAGAQAHKPSIASAKKEELGSAIAVVSQGLATAKTESKRVLYPVLVELYNKNGDTAGATAALAELKKLSPAETANPNSPGVGVPDPSSNANALAAKQAEADTALTKANASMAAHNYDKAIADINAASASFVDPAHQAKALYLIAEARAATATTPEALQDAALAYMRVVAHFKSQADGPAPEALYKTGLIEEKLSKPTEAILIYNQVINEYQDSKAAQEARAAVARLKK